MIKLTTDIPRQAREWRNLHEINKWCRQNHLISEYQHEQWLDKIETDQTIKMFGILDPVNEVGVCGLTSINMLHRSAEFSLYIQPKEQGKNYGKEALIELIKYGFLNLGLNRIFGEVFEGNPSLEVFKSVGFKEEGKLRESYFKSGKFINSIIISVIRNEYKS